MPTSLRDVVAEVEAEWNDTRSDSEDDSDSDDDVADNVPAVKHPVTPLATAPVTVRKGGPLSVLLIHGMWSSTNWFLDAMLGRPLPPEIARGVSKEDQEIASARSKHAWLDAKVDQRNFAHGEDEDAIISCQTAIASGEYHAIILVDLSARDILPAVEAHLGALLTAFAHGGGSVAVTTCEGLLLPPTLTRLFGTAWQPGAYYRTAWEPVARNVARHLRVPTLDVSTPMRAKACCMSAVPAAERLYTSSRARRPAASLGQRVVCPDSTDTAESTCMETSDDADEAAQDVAVAVHAHGGGRLLYCGDAFCSPASVEVLASFCRATPTLDEPPGDGGGARARVVEPGSRVLVRGLASKPQLNGFVGTVLGRQGSGRWQVRLEDASHTEIALRPANLELAPPPAAAVAEETARGRAGDAEPVTPKLPHMTYSPIRILLGVLAGVPPDGRGEVFPKPWMNFAAVTIASITLGLMLSALVLAAFTALQPEDEYDNPRQYFAPRAVDE